MSKNGILITVAEDQAGKSPRIVTETEPFPIALFDGTGNPISSFRGAIDIHDADVHNVIINQYIHQHTVIATTLAVASAPDDYEITVVSSVGFAIGDYLHINTTSQETTHPKITNIVGNVLTLDRRLDKAHLIGDEVRKAIVDMALTGQVGTMAAPQEYWAGPPAGEVWHLTRMLFSMTHGTAGDLGLFGNLSSLPNGVLLRSRVNSEYGTLTNWKNNGDIKTDMYDVEFDSRSGGQGNYGTSGRGTFTNAGAVLRLDGDTNDRFEVYIQDDITALGFFGMKVQGHIEGA